MESSTIVVETQTTAIEEVVSVNSPAKHWALQAEEEGRAVYDRQPGETDAEWAVWEAFRAPFPNALPSNAELAETLQMSLDDVIATRVKWDFSIRLSKWRQRANALRATQRKDDFAETVGEHKKIAKQLLRAASNALMYVDWDAAKPSDIVNVLKLAIEIDRRAVTTDAEIMDADVTTEESATAARANANAPLQIFDKAAVNDILTTLKNIGAMDEEVLPSQSIGIRNTSEIVIRPA